jgi:hypothetical protein
LNKSSENYSTTLPFKRQGLRSSIISEKAVKIKQKGFVGERKASTARIIF